MFIGLGLGIGMMRGSGLWAPSSTIARWRADVGWNEAADTWTDSVGGVVATGVGTLTLTAASIGTRGAISFAAGSLQNTATNLVTAGAAYSVFTVGKATNGAILTIRRDSPYASSLLFTTGGVTYVYSDAATSDSFIANASAETAVSYSACHVYNGAGQPIAFYLNGTSRTILGSFNQATESGLTGFQIGTNSVGQNAGGFLGEVIVKSGAASAADRAGFASYVSAWYGL